MRIFIRFLGQCQCLLFATLRQDVKPPAPSVPPPPPSEGPTGTAEVNYEEANKQLLVNFSAYPRWNPYQAPCQCGW